MTSSALFAGNDFGKPVVQGLDTIHRRVGYLSGTQFFEPFVFDIRIIGCDLAKAVTSLDCLLEQGCGSVHE